MTSLTDFTREFTRWGTLLYFQR